MSERIGLMGGTFDPIHNAHLRIARDAARRCGLSRVLLIPASNPPHRSSGPLAAYNDRCRMVEIACHGDAQLEPSRLEDRPGRSYSIDTVETYLAQAEPGVEVFYIIGADAFAEIRSWHRWRDLARLVTFAVVTRPGARYDVPAETQVRPIEGVNLSTSSSVIRAKLASGRSDVDLPPAVLAYIQEHQLYGARMPGHNPENFS